MSVGDSPNSQCEEGGDSTGNTEINFHFPKKMIQKKRAEPRKVLDLGVAGNKESRREGNGKGRAGTTGEDSEKESVKVLEVGSQARGRAKGSVYLERRIDKQKKRGGGRRRRRLQWGTAAERDAPKNPEKHREKPEQSLEG